MAESALQKEKPPMFEMIQRSGQVAIQMLSNVLQAAIKPPIKATVLPETLTYTANGHNLNDLNPHPNPPPLGEGA